MGSLGWWVLVRFNRLQARLVLSFVIENKQSEGFFDRWEYCYLDGWTYRVERKEVFRSA